MPTWAIVLLIIFGPVALAVALLIGKAAHLADRIEFPHRYRGGRS